MEEITNVCQDLQDCIDAMDMQQRELSRQYDILMDEIDVAIEKAKSVRSNINNVLS